MHLTETLDCAHHPKTDTQHTEMSHNHKIKPLLSHSYLVNTKCLSENHSGMIYLKKKNADKQHWVYCKCGGHEHIEEQREMESHTGMYAAGVSSVPEHLIYLHNGTASADNTHTALSQSCLPPRPPNTQTHTHAHRSCQKPSSFSMSLV